MRLRTWADLPKALESSTHLQHIKKRLAELPQPDDTGEAVALSCLKQLQVQIKDKSISHKHLDEIAKELCDILLKAKINKLKIALAKELGSSTHAEYIVDLKNPEQNMLAKVLWNIILHFEKLYAEPSLPDSSVLNKLEEQVLFIAKTNIFAEPLMQLMSDCIFFLQANPREFTSILASRMRFALKQIISIAGRFVPEGKKEQSYAPLLYSGLIQYLNLNLTDLLMQVVYFHSNLEQTVAEDISDKLIKAASDQLHLLKKHYNYLTYVLIEKIQLSTSITDMNNVNFFKLRDSILGVLYSCENQLKRLNKPTQVKKASPIKTLTDAESIQLISPSDSSQEELEDEHEESKGHESVSDAETDDDIKLTDIKPTRSIPMSFEYLIKTQHAKLNEYIQKQLSNIDTELDNLNALITLAGNLFTTIKFTAQVKIKDYQDLCDSLAHINIILEDIGKTLDNISMLDKEINKASSDAKENPVNQMLSKCLKVFGATRAIQHDFAALRSSKHIGVRPSAHIAELPRALLLKSIEDVLKTAETIFVSDFLNSQMFTELAEFLYKNSPIDNSTEDEKKAYENYKQRIEQIKAPVLQASLMLLALETMQDECKGIKDVKQTNQNLVNLQDKAKEKFGSNIPLLIQQQVQLVQDKVEQITSEDKRKKKAEAVKSFSSAITKLRKSLAEADVTDAINHEIKSIVGTTADTKGSLKSRNESLTDLITDKIDPMAASIKSLNAQLQKLEKNAPKKFHGKTLVKLQKQLSNARAELEGMETAAKSLKQKISDIITSPVDVNKAAYEDRLQRYVTFVQQRNAYLKDKHELKPIKHKFSQLLGKLGITTSLQKRETFLTKTIDTDFRNYVSDGQNEQLMSDIEKGMGKFKSKNPAKPSVEKLLRGVHGMFALTVDAEDDISISESQSSTSKTASRSSK